ncbi:MAG: DUF4157 domain-containing protein [Blastocatellia bacterium]
MAGMVMRAPQPYFQPRVESDEYEKEESAQTKRASSSVPAVTSDFEAGIQRLRQTGGQPLPQATRDFMEPRFGHDFSAVRVHTDAGAAASARAVEAQAYTVGSNVVFGAGKYRPGTSDGHWLIAHELAHVVQQGAGRVAVDASEASTLNRVPEGLALHGSSEALIAKVLAELTPEQIEPFLVELLGREAVVDPSPLKGKLERLTRTQLQQILDSFTSGAELGCADGAFLPNDPASPQVQVKVALDQADRWTGTALALLEATRSGRATPEKASQVENAFSQRMGSPGAFAGMKRSAAPSAAVAKPSTAQTALDVVIDTIRQVHAALPLLKPVTTPGTAPGEAIGFDVTGAEREERRKKVTTSGLPLFCNETPTFQCDFEQAAHFSPYDNAIALCPGAFGMGTEYMAATLLHELVHAVVQPRRLDIYTHQRLFRSLANAPDELGRRGGLALHNPDSIMELIRALNGETGTVKSEAPADQFIGFEGNPDRRAAADLALAFAEERVERGSHSVRWLLELMSGSSTGVRQIVVGGSRSHNWETTQGAFLACSVAESFDGIDPRTAELGDPCHGTGIISGAGVDFIEEVNMKLIEANILFGSALSLRAGAIDGVPAVWMSDTEILLDDSFFSLSPPEQAQAILRGMSRQTVEIPAQVPGDPLKGTVTIPAGVLDGLNEGHLAVMDAALKEAFGFIVGPGG